MKKQPEFLVVLLKATHLTQTYPGFVGEDGVEEEAAWRS
jgi:antibiotic biosynthesis monooxygenase (ABM) superfamily enzyme